MRKSTNKGEWLRILDAARKFKVHHSTVYRWIGEKRVKTREHTGYRRCLLVSARDMANMTGRPGCG